MLLDEVARTSADVATSVVATREGRATLGGCLAASRSDEVPVAVAYLSGSLPHGIDRGGMGDAAGHAGTGVTYRRPSSWLEVDEGPAPDRLC